MHAYELSEEPSSEAKQEALRGLREFWARMDEKTKDIPLAEQDEILE